MDTEMTEVAQEEDMGVLTETSQNEGKETKKQTITPKTMTPIMIEWTDHWRNEHGHTRNRDQNTQQNLTKNETTKTQDKKASDTENRQDIVQIFALDASCATDNGT